MDGKLIGMKIDGAYTPCEISCSLKTSNEQLDASGEHNGNWKHWTEGYKSWSMSVNARLLKSAAPSGFAKIFKKNLLGNQTYEVIIGMKDDATNTEFFIKGNAKLQDLDLNAIADSKAEYNINFIGNGVFTEVNIKEA